MWSRKIRYSYMARNKKRYCFSSKVCDLEQRLFWRTVVTWDECQSTSTFFPQNISRVAVPLFWIQFCLGIHTLRGETLSRCLGMLYSGLWTSCISQLTSGMVSLHPYRNIHELGHSEYRVIWLGDLVTLSHKKPFRIKEVRYTLFRIALGLRVNSERI